MKYLEKYNRYIDNDCVIYRKNKKGKLVQVKPSINNCGYEMICYAYKQTTYVHRLVYEAFKGEIPEGMQIDHIDRNKRNNNPDNLRVVTRSENCNNRNLFSDFGKKYFAHFGYSRCENLKQYTFEHNWYQRHNKKCRWEKVINK